MYKSVSDCHYALIKAALRCKRDGIEGDEFRVRVVGRLTEFFGARIPICGISIGSFHSSKIGLGRAKSGDTETLISSSIQIPN